MAKHADYQISKRKDGRHVVVKRGGGYINGDEKTKILIAAGLIKTKLATPKAAEETEPEA